MVRAMPAAFAAFLLSGLAGCSGGRSNDEGSASWRHVEGARGSINHDPTFVSSTPQLTVVGTKLYAIWREEDPAVHVPRVRVGVYGANDAAPVWNLVDGGGVSGLNEDPAAKAFGPRLTALGSKLYATWQENDLPNTVQVKIAAYDGDDAAPAWTFVHGSGATGLNAPGNFGQFPQLTAFSSRLYAAWFASGQVWIAVYNGDDLAPAWTRVDAGVGSNASLGSGVQLTAFASKLYATWSDSTHVRVLVYNGDDAAPSWRYVDAGGLNNQGVEPMQAQLTVLGSKLYATWIEGDAQLTFHVRVAVYGGNDAAPSWSFVDGGGPNGLNRASAMGAENPQLTAHRSKLYAAWDEAQPNGTGFAVHVAEYGGNDAAPSWTFVDGGGASGLATDVEADAAEAELTVFDGRLYAAWREYSPGGVAHVRVAVAPF